MTRGQLKTTVRQNLADEGVTRFTDDDLNESLQDAYDDVVALSQCYIRRTTINWVSDLSYYDFSALGVTDYLCTQAIFNNVTNQWLRDDLTVRDFDNIRRDWEIWIGTPQFWAPCSFTKIAIAAKYLGAVTSGAFNPFAFSSAYYIGSGLTSLGTFDLIYAAVAPTFTSDSSVPLVAADAHELLEFYATGDLLEQDEEFKKSNEFFEKYYTGTQTYKARVKSLAKSDLLLRI